MNVILTVPTDSEAFTRGRCGTWSRSQPSAEENGTEDDRGEDPEQIDGRHQGTVAPADTAVGHVLRAL
ncbi:hypothetical protein P1P68_02415 [Streptomyces scabiei]|uniref:hypothetical protein n=1 Tax=Streptomyces scabiei TaxID=1930 RepID=UPI00298F7A8B|nr:hypothetical protein [Streptomyces scabiei]MDW8803689.1 hypothetical protein [Streptomyces scabiei]